MNSSQETFVLITIILDRLYHEYSIKYSNTNIDISRSCLCIKWEKIKNIEYIQDKYLSRILVADAEWLKHERTFLNLSQSKLFKDFSNIPFFHKPFLRISV